MTQTAKTVGDLSFFAPTADQRYLLGADVFLRTHFPMTLRRYLLDGRIANVNEDELLNRLLDNKNEAPGNRLWILYGAPGSGKSELMKWLEVRIAEESVNRAETMVRISRNELDILSIAERFQTMLPDGFINQRTRKRWQDARRKPRTLTKIILLYALENLLDSDEDINAIFYLLVNAVHPHVEEAIKAGNRPQTIEIISMETWDAILRETSIEIDFEYEHFRHQLTLAFQDHLLEGLALSGTLRRISENVSLEHGQRPLLLVDDLVQSLNLYATDILDYFLTLEAGSWDVVLGLTPAAFETSQRGRNLLQRIANLDTIDDRVEKLWLSDETGEESFVLTEENCHDFAAHYLIEYHRSTGNFIDETLYPFNREALVRVYRGLPSSKGKARYFLRQLRAILEGMVKGEPILEILGRFAKTEVVAHCDDPQLALVCELFGPLIETDSIAKVLLSAELMSRFGYPAHSRSIKVEPLLKLTLRREAVNLVVEDEEKAAIRDWLLGRSVNRQLLKGLRRGAARWLRTVKPPNLLHHDYVARPSGVLKWQKTYLNTRPPIRIQDVDDETDAILLPRSIGLLAFDLHRYASDTGDSLKNLTNQLASEPELQPLIFRAASYRREVINRLETSLGISLAQFALSLYLFILLIDDSTTLIMPGLSSHTINMIKREQALRTAWKDQLATVYPSQILALYSDFFKLRENLFDGPRAATMIDNHGPEQLLKELLVINTDKIDKHYKLGDSPLKKVLKTVQEIVIRWFDEESSANQISPAARHILDKLAAASPNGLPLEFIPNVVLDEIGVKRPFLYAALRIYLQS